MALASRYAPRALGGSAQFLDEEEEKTSPLDFLNTTQRQFELPTVDAPEGKPGDDRRREDQQFKRRKYGEDDTDVDAPDLNAPEIAAPVLGEQTVPTAPAHTGRVIIEDIPTTGAPSTPTAPTTPPVATEAVTPVTPTAPAAPTTPPPAATTPPVEAAPVEAAPTAAPTTSPTATAGGMGAGPFMALAILGMILAHKKSAESAKNRRDRWRDLMISMGYNPNTITPSSPGGGGTGGPGRGGGNPIA